MVRARYVIAYDLEADKGRRKLAKLLEGYGERMQFSLFEADLSKDELAEVLAKAAEWVKSNDSLRAYPVCASCWAKAETLGRSQEAPLPGLKIV
jgi:CRISPR-associated protein Cas2